MAVSAFTDVEVYVAGHDFTGDTNVVQIDAKVNPLDKTTFGSGSWQELHPGVKSVAFTESGFWQSDASAAVDPEAFPDLGIANRVFTLAPTGAEAGPAYMFQAGKFNYQLLGKHGELAPFSLTAQGDSGHGLVRGQLAKAKGSVSATGALGTGVNLGAVGASQYLYGTFHVFSAGTTITVVLESDDNAGFTSATTRATFGPLTARGGTWATRVAGSITDTHYRLRVTACTGTFVVAGAIGIA